ncbi:hypothetical protein J6X04_01665 [Candidatus Saccharibacteria bacterium]|nr:hypothetical protein [Candidatus Saccharibacteria bacterium]
MTKYVTLKEAKEQQRLRKMQAVAGNKQAAKQEVIMLGRKLIIKDCLVIMPALVILGVVVDLILTLIFDPKSGDLVFLWPYYLVATLILSSLFASVGAHLQKKLKEIQKYKIEHKASLIMTKLTTFFCWLVPIIMIGGPVCLFLYAISHH